MLLQAVARLQVASDPIDPGSWVGLLFVQGDQEQHGDTSLGLV